MKKLLIFLLLISTPALATDRYGRPVYNQNSVNHAYFAGYVNGKNDQRETTTKAVVATALIVAGTIIIYKAITKKDAPINQNGHLSIKF